MGPVTRSPKSAHACLRLNAKDRNCQVIMCFISGGRIAYLKCLKEYRSVAVYMLMLYRPTGTYIGF